MKLSTATFTAMIVLVAVFVTAMFVAPASSMFSRGETGQERAGSGRDEAPPQAPGGRGGEEDSRLTRPEDLVLLEGPDRAAWQQPELIMDALNIAEGSKVADVGAGAGWFTIRLARRVRENGTVYAQDLQRQMVTAIARRVNREGLNNVRVIQGHENSPNLPQKMLDAVLVVDVYPEVERSERVAFLKSLATALRPKGRIGIVNYKPGRGGPGPEGRVASASVEEDARNAGLKVLAVRQDLRYQYLIVLGL
jgi:SAM-dependent methyltransferase